jgi:hypothetical protein
MRWQIWLEWAQGIPRPKPASPTARTVRTLLLLAMLALSLAAISYRFLVLGARDPVGVVEAYYDDLDFRRFGDAYARLDPQTRPTYEQYVIERSVQGGLVASYGKLDSVLVTVQSQEPDYAAVEVETRWVTALEAYTTHQQHTLVRRGGQWYIEPEAVDVSIPPDQFFRRGTVAWGQQGRRRATAESTAFADVLDRPELTILSARLVQVNERYSVVGELINADADPGDVTVTALLFDAEGNELTRYNAQAVMMHKLLPGEVTPFRVDFEGVAGAVLTDTTSTATGEFAPDAFSPPQIVQPVASFAVYARAVVTGRDLYREVAAQEISVILDDDGSLHLRGDLLNNGTQEATIPQVLVTCYDERNRVAWVEHTFVEQAIRPQRAVPFALRLPAQDEVETLHDGGDLFTAALPANVSRRSDWRERIPLPDGAGCAALRLSVHSYVARAE